MARNALKLLEKATSSIQEDQLGAESNISHIVLPLNPAPVGGDPGRLQNLGSSQDWGLDCAG